MEELNISAKYSTIIEYYFVKGLLFIAATVVGFIILNEIIQKITGSAIIG